MQRLDNRPVRCKTIFTTLDSAVVRGTLCVVVWATVVHESRATETPINIDRLDPRFDQFVPKDAKLETIADGFIWVEGPVWHKQGEYLLFSDIAANNVYK